MFNFVDVIIRILLNSINYDTMTGTCKARTELDCCWNRWLYNFNSLRERIDRLVINVSVRTVPVVE